MTAPTVWGGWDDATRDDPFPTFADAREIGHLREDVRVAGEVDALAALLEHIAEGHAGRPQRRPEAGVLGDVYSPSYLMSSRIIRPASSYE